MFAVVRDTPSSWEDYRLLATALGTNVPEGLLIRVAGRTAEGVRVIELWHDRAHFARFEEDTLTAARASISPPFAADTVRELVVEHLLQQRPKGRPTSDRLEVGGGNHRNEQNQRLARNTNRKEE